MENMEESVQKGNIFFHRKQAISEWAIKTKVEMRLLMMKVRHSQFTLSLAVFDRKRRTKID